MYTMDKIRVLGTDRSHGSFRGQQVRVDEKIDGSQITFGVFDGRLRVRSKSRDRDLDNPDKMFAAGIASIRERAGGLLPNHTYIGEYLQKPKHNVLCYDRVPIGHIVVFDVIAPDGTLLRHHVFADHVQTAGFEPVQTFHQDAEAALAAALNNPQMHPNSQLGGITEGVVIKAGTHVSKRIVAKLVADQFKEIKSDNTMRVRPNPTRDFAIVIANKYVPPARFMKAVQRMRENGEAAGAMDDIPRLRELVSRDLEEECGEAIREELYDQFRKEILRNSLAGLAAWYEQLLLNDNAFWTARREEVNDRK